MFDILFFVLVADKDVIVGTGSAAGTIQFDIVEMFHWVRLGRDILDLQKINLTIS